LSCSCAPSARWRDAHQRPREGAGREFPSPEALRTIAPGLRGVLFPMRLGPPDLRQEGEDFYVGHTLDHALNDLLEQVRLELRGAAASSGCACTRPSRWVRAALRSARAVS
jgi:serine O-acetyltransferase